ncbi:Protoheme IX farnesyltransferase, mitochondrial, partial [Kappamyces sp. JEL0680]
PELAGDPSPKPRDQELPIGIKEPLAARTEEKWKPQAKFSPAFYGDLTKAKLTAFVLLTTMAGYAIAPGAVGIATLLSTTLGTGLCIASANSINQWTEIPYDAQMARTRNRVLVRHALSPTHAFLFGSVSGVVGTAILYTVNPVSALLGFGNILLYTCVYTPMKRTSIYNTWPGAVVGAIPPLIGWVASTGSIDTGALLLAGALYAWQFPHFNSLSWNLRPDYSKAGYRMMSVIDPAMNARVSLRYALAMFPISLGCYLADMTTWYFLLDSSLVNGYMAWFAFQFWKESTNSRARALFFSSLVHLPVFLILLMIHKKPAADLSDDGLAGDE